MRMGVEMSCSMEPRSHSREMVPEVRMAARMTMMMAIRPGTMKFFDSRSGLNQMRIRGSMGGRCFPPRGWFIFLDDELLGIKGTIAEAYPRAMVAVLASVPSIRTWIVVSRSASRSREKLAGMTRPMRAWPLSSISWRWA